jgi:hypothetical protein
LRVRFRGLRGSWDTGFRGSVVRMGSWDAGFRGVRCPLSGVRCPNGFVGCGVPGRPWYPVGSRPRQGPAGRSPTRRRRVGLSRPPSLSPEGPPGPDRTVGDGEASGVVGVLPQNPEIPEPGSGRPHSDDRTLDTGSVVNREPGSNSRPITPIRPLSARTARVPSKSAVSTPGNSS